jgi:hypothetical protein
MTEQFTRLKESNLTVICRDCRKEFRGAEVRQHTGLEGHEVFDLKPAVFSNSDLNG